MILSVSFLFQKHHIKWFVEGSNCLWEKIIIEANKKHHFALRIAKEGELEDYGDFDISSA